MKRNRAGKWYCVICTVLIVLSLAGCGRNGTASRNTAGNPDAADKSSGAATEGTTAAQATTAETQPAQTSSAQTQPLQATTAGNQGITEADAKQIALKHANVNESDAVYMQVKLERDHGRDEYDVEFYTGNTEYDYEIDAVTGDILSFDYDAESYVPPAGQSGNASGSQTSGETTYITPDQAKAAAFAHANVSEGDTARLKVEFDQDHGKAEYDVEFDVGYTEYEYEIDAVTGEVISYEMDHD